MNAHLGVAALLALSAVLLLHMDFIFSHRSFKFHVVDSDSKTQRLSSNKSTEEREFSFSVVQYNALMNGLSSNFIPRTMLDPTPEALLKAKYTPPDDSGFPEAAKVLAEAFVGMNKDPTCMQEWADLKKKLDDEYRKWHGAKVWLSSASSNRVKARELWKEKDLAAGEWTQIGDDSGDLFAVIDSTKAHFNSVEITTLYGVMLNHFELVQPEGRTATERAEILYSAIQWVHESSFSWSKRGATLFNRIIGTGGSIIALEEYDMHDLTLTKEMLPEDEYNDLFEHPSSESIEFYKAMGKRGYEGGMFLGPGQKDAGLGLYWKSEDFFYSRQSFRDWEELATSNRIVPSGFSGTSCWNVDLGEPGFKKSDRRSVAIVRLTPKAARSKSILAVATHLMTISRDGPKSTFMPGFFRTFELARIREVLAGLATADDAVVFMGDFNIDNRNRREASIFKVFPWLKHTVFTGYVEEVEVDEVDEATGMKKKVPLEKNHFAWERTEGDLILEDAFGDVNSLADSSTSFTPEREEMLDYVFYDKEKLKMTARDPDPSGALKCTETMPNAAEPSDHIPLKVTLEFK